MSALRVNATVEMALVRRIIESDAVAAVFEYAAKESGAADLRRIVRRIAVICRVNLPFDSNVN